jgi:hypothetical protein
MIRTTSIFGYLVGCAISSDNTGFDCGILSIRIVKSKVKDTQAALRIVIWRLAIWVQVTK